MTNRVFSGEDQLAFARLSGDWNPMHVDEIAARRAIFGGRVIHGIHLLLWALDHWFSQHGAPRAIGAVAADFKRGILVGDQLECVIAATGPEVVLQIQRAGVVMSEIRVRLDLPVSYAPALAASREVPCWEASFAEAAAVNGVEPLALDPALCASLLPYAAAALPPYQIASLLASTRIVGMISPGLHSLYLGLEMEFNAPAGEPELRYSAERADARYGLLRLAVKGPGVSGKLHTLMRPAPCAQPAFDGMRQLVADGEFRSQRALVIGGSRGLGEVTAKLLAAGGAEVIATYQRGQADAEQVAADIRSGGGQCVAAAFDIQQPDAASFPPPTHVYYFATPRIALDKSIPFSRERFELFNQFYVSGFVHSLLCLGRGEEALTAMYPSTVFLDQPVPGALEYCAAKAAGEEASRHLMQRFPRWRIHTPRLPRMMTDQNAGVMPSRIASPVAVMLAELRRMNQVL